MIKPSTSALRYSLPCVFLLCQVGSPANASIVGSAVDNGGGSFIYSYTIDNTLGVFDISAFSLQFNFPDSFIDWNQLDVAGGGSVVVPDPNWVAQPGIPVPGFGLSAQDFLSLVQASDVILGTSLPGFSFISAIPPGPTTYFLEFSAQGDTASGTTVGPVLVNAIPEVGGSSTVIAFASVGCVAGAVRLFRFRREH